MQQEIAAVQERAESELKDAGSTQDLDAWQSKYLSRKGEVKALLRGIGKVKDPQEKKQVGQQVNALSQQLESALADRRQALASAELDTRLAAETIDVTLPGTRLTSGREHPVNQMMRKICDIFQHMGFQIFESPHIETDEYNFELVNFPKHHPAREMQDTFFVSEDVVARTHTTPGQIHAMRACAPEPLRAILPGTCYRNEAITPRSEIQFHQVEGIAIGENVGLADLKGVLEEFVHVLFGSGRKTLLRGSYFPFTEPSVEMDVECILCDGKGCRLCKYSGWLEILGAGVVHPNVLRSGGYDPDQFSGFAFGVGIERIVLLQHGIDDIRHFLAGDLRFFEQFP
ncbi:MAG: phenylalanine--tRNA ligase subunit alpha [Planctomycetota bacterium]